MSRVWRELRPYLAPALGVVGYAILRAVFAHVAGSRGLVTPSGSPGTGLVVLALALLVMRVTVLVGVPLVVMYRVVQRLFALGGAGSGASHGAGAGETLPRPPASTG